MNIHPVVGLLTPYESDDQGSRDSKGCIFHEEVNMGLIQFFILALVVGLVVWAIWKFTPIPIQIKKVILWAAVIVLVVILLSAMGIFGHDVAIPKLR